MSKSKTFKIGKFWVSVGMGKRLALAISIDKYMFNLDILCFWLSVEL